MGRYKKPNKINFVSFLMVAALLAAGYSGYQFGPHYYHKWKAKGILSDAANQAYPKRMVEGWDLQEFLSGLQTKTEKRLKEVGIDDPKLDVKITVSPKEIVAEASYVVIINHPFIDKTTTLYFRPKSSVNAGERPY